MRCQKPRRASMPSSRAQRKKALPASRWMVARSAKRRAPSQLAGRQVFTGGQGVDYRAAPDETRWGGAASDVGGRRRLAPQGSEGDQAQGSRSAGPGRIQEGQGREGGDEMTRRPSMSPLAMVRAERRKLRKLMADVTQKAEQHLRE